MAERLADITLQDSDDLPETLRINGETYSLSPGDTLTVPDRLAGRMVNRWGFATRNGGAYEVDEDHADDRIGRIDDDDSDSVESMEEVIEEATDDAEEYSDMSYNELRSLASEKGVDSSGTKEQLVARLQSHDE